MAEDFGPNVSRTLDAQWRQFGGIIWQKQRPPLDAEANLRDQVNTEKNRLASKVMMPSGFVLDPTRAQADYQFDKNWSNFFVLANPRVDDAVWTYEKDPAMWAVVNGWVLPIIGTNITSDDDTRNIIKLFPSPESDSRVDFIFLEVWQALINPNPSEVNKPTADTLYKYGNVKYTGTQLVDDLEDPAKGYETAKRTQVQYRIRVFGEGSGLGSGVALDVYPDGLDDPNVFGQGTSTTPLTGGGAVMNFANMREEMGDPSLWRAGDGDPDNDLGTIDGYSYAIPICAVFRRNSNVFVAVESAGNANQNGAFSRNPGAGVLPNPLDGAKTLLTATLTDFLPYDGTGTIDITNMNGSGLEDTALVLDSTFLVIENEIIGISAVDAINETITISSRGRYGTDAVGHAEGCEVLFFNSRPDNLFADEVAQADVLDLRRGINPGDWDFKRILLHNVGALVKGDLRTAWKQSSPGDTEGPVVTEVDYLLSDGGTAVPNQTEALDGADGIRTVWSDASVYHPDVTLLLDNETAVDSDNITTVPLDSGAEWDVGADFKPGAFFNTGPGNPAESWTNGSMVFLHIGGDDGSGGARTTFRDGGERAVRFVTPKEYWKAGFPQIDPAGGNQYPVTLRFLDQRSHEPVEPIVTPATLDAELPKHPGPMYPWRELNFESPFIVLGGLLRSDLKTSIAATDLSSAIPFVIIDTGIDFDLAGSFYTKDANGEFVNDPTVVSSPLLRGQRTLYDMLTDGGRDRTGNSSEVYVILYGDADSSENNGCFRVVAAGTTGYTYTNAPDATSIITVPLSADATSIVSPGTGNTLTLEFRSQFTNAEDGTGASASDPAMVVVLTDIGGEDASIPWARVTLDTLGIPTSGVGEDKVAVASKMVLSTALLYHPGRGGTARVADQITRVALRQAATSTYLRQAPGALDTDFPAFSGMPADEIFFDPSHVQTWNRLESLGWHAPDAPGYGGKVIGFTEQDRESELFVDKGSKTVIFRPLRDRQMTLQGQTTIADPSLIGELEYPSTVAKDSLALWTGGAGAGKLMGFPVPREYMPRFGRQDIPFYPVADASGTFLFGINHLFLDSTDGTRPVFSVVGGESNTIGGGVNVRPLFFMTDDAAGTVDYGESTTIVSPSGTVPAYVARKSTNIAGTFAAQADDIIARLNAVQSSDLGAGLKGIMLPPYHGVARVYGVYDKRDYDAKGGRTFKADRVTPEDDPATNLLRQDVDKQSLFIFQGGAADFTDNVDDHTYIIPLDAIDFTKAPDWVDTEVFEDFEFIVEMVGFGFAQGFINKNNFVLVRRVDGEGVEQTSGSDPELEGIHMILPAPAGVSDGLYTAYNRTVYQGDPFMTRAGETRTVTDYEHRYGQIPTASAHEVGTPIQQFDINTVLDEDCNIISNIGGIAVEAPNGRAFQVLAALDFYTTLGTGNIGGRSFPGTPLDVGFTENTPEGSTRIPDGPTDPAWRVLTRTFSEGQKTSDSRAMAVLEIVDNDLLNPASLDHAIVRLGLLDGTVLDLFASTAANESVLTTAGASTDDIFTVDVDSAAVSKTETIADGSLLFPTPFTAGGADQTQTAAIASGIIADAEVGDALSVVPSADISNTYGSLSFHAWMSGAGVATVVGTYTLSPHAFEDLVPAGGTNVLTIAGALPGILPAHGGAGVINIAFPGTALGDVILVGQTGGAAPWPSVSVTGRVSAAGFVDFTFTNQLGVANDQSVGPGVDFTAVALRDGTLPDLSVPAVPFVVSTHTTRSDPEVTAQNLVTLINGHDRLKRSVTAYSPATTQVVLEAVPTGEEGNNLSLSIRHREIDPGAPLSEVGPSGTAIETALRIRVPTNNDTAFVGTHPSFGAHNITFTQFRGGVNSAVNAGNGTTQLRLTGMTERLPLGILLQDSDFLGENPLGDDATALKTSPAGIRPVQTLLPLTSGGEEFTRFLGEPGALVAMADGKILGYVAFTDATPTGSRRFRLYRGGGSAFVLSGINPGGPIDWVSESFPETLDPVLKGGVLACKALLVRNFPEAPFSTPVVVSEGDEIQMIVITHGLFGNGRTQEEGITLSGIISPTGYGEGYAASDRYRCTGRPMYRAFTRSVPDVDKVTLAVFSGEED